ncbi:MAG: malate synthase [Tissierellia bacterium]|nr:malate synthase [Tissierellia bacterium]
MDLINKQVIHKSFGKGTIVEFADTYLVINFESGNKSFVYPDAFADYLTLTDKEAAKKMDVIVRERKIEQKKEEERLAEEKAIELEERQRQLEIEKLRKNHRLHASSQVAFNCKDEELDTIFTEWKVFAGAIKSGANKGKPNKLVRTHQNTACIVTTRADDIDEKERRILAVYMVEETFVGRLCEDGYIPAHPQYRIRLTEQESKEILFWKYYINNRYPDNMTWNSGRYRYFENIWMAQILRDIISLRSNEEAEEARKFFEYFCIKNQIDEKELPAANGPLTRIS